METIRQIALTENKLKDNSVLSGIRFRPATDVDCLFAYELKKAVDFDLLTLEHGWDEELQWALHLHEWNTGLPTVICHQDKPIGTYMLLEKSDQLYFSRFFILPEYPKNGIGSKVIRNVVRYSQQTYKSCFISYLKTNKAANLYQRMGFEIYQVEGEVVYAKFSPQDTN